MNSNKLLEYTKMYAGVEKPIPIYKFVYSNFFLEKLALLLEGGVEIGSVW